MSGSTNFDFIIDLTFEYLAILITLDGKIVRNLSVTRRSRFFDMFSRNDIILLGHEVCDYFSSIF